ncbi:hypothetical protein V6N12_014127 [Hibiscus sabdariffa]|uniref:DUF4283 domain-containing protein n=1 Tax=Hibiscus sabdariffa TaxID=183260 RepID=A0ABR2DJ87_9ROSI
MVWFRKVGPPLCPDNGKRDGVGQPLVASFCRSLLPTKYRRLDDDPPDGGGGSPTSNSVHPVVGASNHVSSYKESLMMDNTVGDQPFADFFEDEDIDLHEGDVTRSFVDGLISIDFSDWVQSLAEKSLDQTLVVKLLGRRIGYTTLRTKIHELWKPKQAIRLMDIENDYFLVSFQARSDYLQALAGGPWTVFGHYLTVQQWNSEFSTSVLYPTKVMVWICLPGLPVTLYKRSIIEEIGTSIGPVEGCPDLRNAQDLSVVEPILPVEAPSPAAAPSDSVSFGPWMVAARRTRKLPPNQSSSKVPHVTSFGQASRFSPIFVSDSDGINVSHSAPTVPTHVPSIPGAKQKSAMAKKKSAISGRNFKATTYFHRRALCRKQRNKITALKISDGSWCDDDDTLMSEAVGFFKTLFEDNGSPEDVFPIRNSFPQLSSDALRCLDSVPSGDEIHGALMEMAPLKSPGWDDFMDVNGNWDTHLLSSIFPHSVISHIVSIKCPDANDIANKPFWRMSTSHSFSIRSAYESLSDTGLNSPIHWQRPEEGSDVNALVRAIVKMRDTGWVTKIRWIPREANKLVDAMAKFDSANGLSLFAVPPSPLQLFLDSDVSILMY